MPDGGLLGVHRPGGLALALDQVLELRLDPGDVFFGITELPGGSRRLLAQRRERRRVHREPRDELLALPAFGLDLESRRFEALGLLTQRADKLLAAPADRLNGLLGPRDLGPRIDHVPIPAVVRVRRFRVGGPRLLELRLDPALTGQRRIQPALLVRDMPRVAARFLVAGPPLEGEVLGLEVALCRLELAVLSGKGGLALEVREPARELLAQVVQPVQVLLRVAHPVLGLAPAFLVPGDSRRFLDDVAQIVGLRLDDPRDRSLLDDRVAAGAEPGTVEHVHHVAAPASRSVQRIRRLPFAHELTAHRDLVVRGETAAGAAVQIVEHELDARAAHRLARPRAVEHHVRHGVAAQAARRYLAHDPANRIDDVRLPAAVGPDDTDDVTGKLDGGGIDEGLEAREPNLA